MKLGIIVAMEEELKVVLNDMEVKDKSEHAGMVFYDGIYHDLEVIAVVCGVGKVNAAVCTQILISVYGADKIVNIGVAGGVRKDIKQGDVVIADTLIQHDVDAKGFGYDLGRIPRLDVFDFKSDRELINICLEAGKEGIKEHQILVGRIVTGDQFIASAEKTEWLDRYFGAFACEMEGASIAQVCHLNKVPFVVIRSISDNADSEAAVSFDEFLETAVENATVILEGLVKELKKAE